MIASLIQRLTLIAFAAHAVLGCCLHHAHASSTECCAGHVVIERVVIEHAVTDHETACHHQGHCSQTHRGSSIADEVTAASFHSRPIIKASCFGDSHQPLHECHENRCNFASASLKPLCLALEVIVWDTVLEDRNIALLTKRFASTIDSRQRRRLEGSSNNYRAVLQSWQI